MIVEDYLLTPLFSGVIWRGLQQPVIWHYAQNWRGLAVNTFRTITWQKQAHRLQTQIWLGNCGNLAWIWQRSNIQLNKHIIKLLQKYKARAMSFFTFVPVILQIYIYAILQLNTLPLHTYMISYMVNYYRIWHPVTPNLISQVQECLLFQFEIKWCKNSAKLDAPLHIPWNGKLES